MNTDAILDFVVENYIWFIVGGAILFLAILGVVVDKKKLMPKGSAKKENNNSEPEQLIFEEEKPVEQVAEPINDYGMNDVEQLNDNQMIDNNVALASEPVNEVETTIDNTDNSINDVTYNKEQENFSNVFNFDNNDNQENFVQTANIDEVKIEEEHPDYDSMIEEYNPVMNENSSLGNYEYSPVTEIEDSNYQGQPITENVETYSDDVVSTTQEGLNELTPSEDIKEPEVVNEELANDSASENIETEIKPDENYKMDRFAFSTVDDDINRINDMKFSDEKSDKEDEKLEDTMQISYSQLKEIVQDIMNENETDTVVPEENMKQPEEKNELNENLEMPNNESAASSAQQDEKDDVWKF